MLLTKDTTFIIGPIAQLMGYLMNGIFWVLDKIGIPNVGLSIIFFTIIIYLCMLPLTYKQQKFSKLSQRMQPELNAIQKKYKGKSDEASQAKMNEETQALYKKYGISPMGSCGQLLIQMPILFALYRVIYNVPAYVTQVKNAFFPLVTNLMEQTGASEYLQNTSAGANFTSSFSSDDFLNNVGDTVSNVYIDVLNRFSTTEWTELAEQFSSLADQVSETVAELTMYNNFLGLNIANSPWYTFKNALGTGSILAIIGAVSVPVLAALTQIINVALVPQQKSTGDKQQDQMQNSMKTMNLLMPLMSAWFCFTLPAGMGLYWIAGAVIRSIQQVVLNRHFDRIDMDAYLEKVKVQNEQKEAKKGGKKEERSNVMAYSSMNTKRKTISERADYNNAASYAADVSNDVENDTETAAGGTGAASSSASGAPVQYRKGSLTERAHMVSSYNNVEKTERNSTGRISRKRRMEMEQEQRAAQEAASSDDNKKN